MKDIDLLTKKELKQLINKTVGKGKKKKKNVKKKNEKKKNIKRGESIKRKAGKAYSVKDPNEVAQNFQERLVTQKPIIARTSQGIPTFMPNMGGLSSMDQRASDVLRSDINKSENTLVAVKEEIKNIRSQAQ